MKKVVLDASIIVKLFTKEPKSEKASKILDSYLKGELTVSAPTLVIWEVLNALKYYEGFPRAEIGRVGVALISYGFNLVEANEELVKTTVDFALKFDLTIYDACYLALAKLSNCELITADEKFFEKIKTLGFVRSL
jgi:predicted nucleic acid-binding protein